MRCELRPFKSAKERSHLPTLILVQSWDSEAPSLSRACPRLRPDLPSDSTFTAASWCLEQGWAAHSRCSVSVAE